MSDLGYVTRLIWYKETKDMSEFVYLYRGGRRPESPAGAEKELQKWVAWLDDLVGKGHIKDRGQPLDPAGKVVRDRAGSVTDGPYAESKDIVGGFTIVEATDLVQAAELAKGCPTFENGGFVEVRPVMKM
jgi:hypothetical protein